MPRVSLKLMTVCPVFCPASPPVSFYRCLFTVHESNVFAEGVAGVAWPPRWYVSQ